MEPLERYYSTTNMSLASYIRAHGIDLREVRSSSSKDPRGNPICEFVFRAENDDPKINFLVSEWEENSTESIRLIKKVMKSAKVIRAALKLHLSAPARLEEELEDVFLHSLD